MATRQATEETSDPGPRAGRRRRRTRVAIAALALGAVVLVVVAARLLAGPVFSGLPAGLVASRIEQRLGPDASVDVGVVGFALDAAWKPELHLRDVVVRRAGQPALSIDTLAITLDWGASGRAVDRLIADHVLVDLGAAGDAGPLPTVADVLGALDGALAAPPLGYVEIGALSVRRGAGERRITVLDEVAVTLDEDREGGLSLQVAGSGAAGSWSIRGTAGSAGADGARQVALRATGLDVADLAAMAGAPESRVTGPVGFEGSVTLAGPRVTAAEGKLTVGPLSSPDEGAVPVVGAGTRLEVSLRPGGDTVVLYPSPVVLPGGRALVSGEIALPQAAGAPFGFDLRLALRGTGSEDARHGAAEIHGTYDPAAGLLAVDDFHATGEGATFAAAMRLSHGSDHVAGALSGVFPSMSVDALKSLWPTTLVAGARRWVVDNVESGTVREATVDLAVSDQEIGRSGTGAASATLAFGFENLAFRAYDDGPMIRRAFGRATLENGRFEVTLDRGDVDLGPGRTLAITGGRFVVPDVAAEPTPGEVALDLSGPAAGAVALWSTLPLSAGADVPAAPEDVSGQVSGHVTLSLPLVRGVSVRDVVYDARVAFAELAIAKPVDGRTLSDGSIAVTVSNGSAIITGDALIDGVRAEINLTEPLTGTGVAATSVRLRMNDKDRARLGLDLGSLVSGPVTVSLDQQDGEGEDPPRRVEVDLEDAALSLAALGLEKPAGKPGKATFALRETGERIEITDLSVEAGGIRVAGSVTLDRDGRLLAADLPRVTVRAGDRLAISARRGDDGVLAVSVKGTKFDARRLVRQELRGGGTGGPGGDIRIEAAVDQVTGFGEEAFTGFNLSAAMSGDRLERLAMTAQTAGGGATSMTLTPVGGSRRLEIEAGEVGRVLRFLGVYGRVAGGRAVVTGVVDRSGGIKAAVDGSRWRIVGEPALARLSTAAEEGPTAGLATADIERLMFELSFAGGRLRIDDGVVRGATAGVSIQGEVDFSRDTLRLSGSYLPANAVDSLIGKIPLIGQTMFAGGRAGLLGVTFRLSGSIEDPTLTVNPLSAIAPGILRKLFELR